MKLLDLLLAGYAALKIVSETDRDAEKVVKDYEAKIKELKQNSYEKKRK